MPRQYYTLAERTTVAVLYPSAPRAEVLAALPGRSWPGITIIASELKIRRNTVWSAAEVALLRAEYPLQGAAAVGVLLGKARLSVVRKAFDLGIRRQHASLEVRKALKAARSRLQYARKIADQPVRPARVPKPARVLSAAPVKAARLVMVPTALGLPVKQRPMLPNLNAAKSGRKRAEQAATATVAITADAIRKLPANHPARHAYAMGGVLGWQQWQARQAA